MPSRRPRTLLTGLLAVLALAGAVPAASAVQVRQSAVVSATPRAATPSVVDGTVNAYAQVGAAMVAGGTFTEVTDETHRRHLRPASSLVAFEAATGRVSTTFRPVLQQRRRGRVRLRPRCPARPPAPSTSAASSPPSTARPPSAWPCCGCPTARA